jgi:glycosyltransferase involved in cell wall biosynthesis
MNLNTSFKTPLVSVLTPVYNGESYLAECIESVLAQSYSNWEYIIVNNCSKDATLDIAERYASMDKRIRVYGNEQLLDIISNHNRAFRLIAADSKYCKVVSADDWIFSECLSKMVGCAEANPSAGIVGSYQLSGGGADGRSWRVRWDELPYPSTLVPGRLICRSQLLGGPYVFGTPTSILYRSDLIRSQESFYPNSTAEADTSACYKYLQNTDFAFVHQVLSYERIHEATTSANCRRLNTYESSRISDLIQYGPSCLTPVELDTRLQTLLDSYYRFLAASFFHARDRAFWEYHKRRLAEVGHTYSRLRLSKAVCAKCLDLVLNPKRTAESLLKRGLREGHTAVGASASS